MKTITVSEAPTSRLFPLIRKNMSIGAIGDDGGQENPELWLGGVGKAATRIMFVQTCVTEAECATTLRGDYGKTVPVDPALCHCAEWLNLKMYASLEGIDVEDCYVTAFIKSLPEKETQRKNPGKVLQEKFMPWLREELFLVKPKIIVCVGKPVFDALSGVKTRESDIFGLWHYVDKYRAFLYFIPGLHMALKPDMDERYLQDFRSIKRKYDNIVNDVPADEMQVDYSYVVDNAEDLKALVGKLEAADATVLSVDCEWGGQVHVDGLLRSLQIAWSDTEAVYIKFRDENANLVFKPDVECATDKEVYRSAGRILSKWLDNPRVKYIGHHLSADLSWMHYWLGLEWYNKGIFDTEFALQTCDEALDLGLDVLALKYTDFGKYDWDLIQYRKTHPDRRGTGYELIPDSILIPYGMKDVLTVYRAWPKIRAMLEAQPTSKGNTLAKYYDEILNPFVTNVFTWFCVQGMPVDRQKLDVMRELYNWAKNELQKDFIKSVVKEADAILKSRLEEWNAGESYEDVAEQVAAGNHTMAEQILHSAVLPAIQSGVTSWSECYAVYKHYVCASDFNIRSSEQMRNWLFKVKKYEPVKTTSMKDQGMPSMDWSKVKSYDAATQAKFTPAVDKLSLEIFASKYDDQVLRELLELNSVGNVCKAFLRPADVDDDGNVVKENGIHYWVTSEDTICLNHSTTETGRPRS